MRPAPAPALGDRPPFDPNRAGFYLIAAVLAVHCVVVLMAATACVINLEIILVKQIQCDHEGRLAQLLASALAAALAFAGIGRPK